MSYDWRLDNRKHLPRLRLFLDDLLRAYYGDITFVNKSDRRVVLIAHSMGGLITRWFQAQCPEEFDQKVAWFITLGTPHQGAAEPLMVMASGVQSNGSLVLVVNFLAEGMARDIGLEMADRMVSNAQLMAFDHEFFRIVLPDGTRLGPFVAREAEEQIQGAYVRAYEQLVDRVPYEIVPKPEEFHAFSEEQRQVLHNARDFQDTIKLARPPRLIHFAGINRKTVGALVLTFSLRTDHSRLEHRPSGDVTIVPLWMVWAWEWEDGDGTVPEWGLEMTCFRRYDVQLSDDHVHRSLGSDRAIQGALRRIVAGALAPGEHLG